MLLNHSQSLPLLVFWIEEKSRQRSLKLSYEIIEIASQILGINPSSNACQIKTSSNEVQISWQAISHLVVHCWGYAVTTVTSHINRSIKITYN
jgi:hypothetical protein